MFSLVFSSTKINFLIIKLPWMLVALHLCKKGSNGRRGTKWGVTMILRNFLTSLFQIWGFENIQPWSNKISKSVLHYNLYSKFWATVKKNSPRTREKSLENPQYMGKFCLNFTPAINSVIGFLKKMFQLENSASFFFQIINQDLNHRAWTKFRQFLVNIICLK